MRVDSLLVANIEVVDQCKIDHKTRGRCYKAVNGASGLKKSENEV